MESNIITIRTACGKDVLVDADVAEWLGDQKLCLSQGYPSFRRNGSCIRLHHLVNDPHIGMLTDHRDRNRLNCTRDNLRMVTRRENNFNKGALVAGTSKYCGVSAFRGKWRAQIKSDGVNKNLGYFDDEWAAAQAYNRAAVELRGALAFQNEP